MKINVYGMGYVGCVSAACLASEGFYVTGIDIDEEKVNLINSGKSPVVEEGLDELVSKGVSSGRLKATVNEIPEADISFICVGTPSRENGSLELGHVLKVTEDIGKSLRKTERFHVVSVRSTVLPGTTEEKILPLLEKVSGKKAGEDFGLCMNPEFMREGSSIKDFYNPPFTIIGELNRRSGELLEKLYSSVNGRVFITTIKVAEMVKYACNLFHALKITFANEIGNFCKVLGIDSHEVMEIFCADEKLNISKAYLKPGFAFGGSCLPKDLRAVLYRAKEKDLELPMLNSILTANRKQIEHAFGLISKNRGKRIGVCGLSFKQGTDDLRESPLVDLIEMLIGKGFDVSIYDPDVSINKIRGANRRYILEVIPHISSLIIDNIDDFISNIDLLVIGKNLPEVKNILKKSRRDLKIIDLVKISRDIYQSIKSYEGICW